MDRALAKKLVIKAIEELPEEKVEELMDFAEFMLSKTSTRRPNLSLDPDNDPILKFIGLANEEPFADNIDDDLYGS